MQRPGLSFKNSFFAAIAALISPSLALASLDFPSYPAKEITVECGKPDFTSYSRARNAEDMIRKNNPDLKKPNFGGQYLLLQVPYMMGTDWLILDCKTGTFLKEVITGQAEFKKDSFLVRLSDKTSTEWKLWTGSTFVKAEETKKSESKPAENSLTSRYAETFSGFPAGPVKSTCAPLKFSSYFRAQTAEMHIKNQKTDLSRPNFAGNFILLRVDLLFETIHIIASCETGLFYTEYLSGDLTYKADSALAILTKSGKVPDLFLWHAPLWIKRPDPTASDGPFIFNEIAREDARSFIRLLPNPENHSKVEFEDLVCRTTIPSGCSFRLPGTKEPEKRVAFLEAPSQGVIDLLQRLGRVLPKDASGAAGLQIDQGHCIPEKSTCKLGVK